MHTIAGQVNMNISYQSRYFAEELPGREYSFLRTRLLLMCSVNAAMWMQITLVVPGFPEVAYGQYI